jgi:exodeoxyribonuclease-5
VFQLRAAVNGNLTAITGIVDAITQGKDGGPEVVIDWKSDVAPAPETRQHHAAQVREYLDCSKAERGLVVYMTTGEVQEVVKRT